MTKDVILQDVFAILQDLGDFWWSLPIVSLSGLLFYFFTHPDKIAVWSSLIASLFEKISKRSARHSVASDIQGRISSYIKNNNSGGILSHGLKFKWIKDENFSSYIDEDDVIVIMDYHNNNARNFVNAINQYISKAFLVKIRHELPFGVLSAAELTMQEKIIREKRPDALDIFQDETLSKQIADDDRIKTIYEKFKKLDMFGYFDNIFLPEIIFTGQRLQGMNTNQKINEITNFLEFLIDIEDENRPLNYNGDVFCVQIILVAKAFKKYLGVEPYIRRAREASSNKTNSLYVAGREQNMDFVDNVVDEINKENIGRLEWVRKYKALDKKRNKRNVKIVLYRL